MGQRGVPALEQQRGCCGVLSGEKSLEEAGERKRGAFLTGKCLALEDRESLADCGGGWGRVGLALVWWEEARRGTFLVAVRLAEVNSSPDAFNSEGIAPFHQFDTHLMSAYYAQTDSFSSGNSPASGESKNSKLDDFGEDQVSRGRC